MHLHELELGKDFLDRTAKAYREEKIEKFDIIKIKNFTISKDSIKKVERTAIEWEG